MNEKIYNCCNECDDNNPQAKLFNEAVKKHNLIDMAHTPYFYLVNALRNLDKEQLIKLTKELADRCGLEIKETL